MRTNLIRTFCLMTLVVAVGRPALSQTVVSGTRNWWAPGNSGREVTEKGKFAELQTRKKVYINVSFAEARLDTPISPTERRAVEQAVKEAVSSQKGLQIVNVPETAEFAVLVRMATNSGGGERGPNFSLTLDENAEVSVDVTVVVPGAKQPNGSFVPRVVWESSSPHAQVEAPAAARFTVDGFLWELKKLHEKK